MTEDVHIILDLSPAVQELLEEQGIDLYAEIQRQVPSVRISMQSDLNAPTGSRGDVVTIIVVTTSLISTLTPIILRILNMIAPPDRAQTYHIEETITHSTDGNTTIVRKRVLSLSEQHPALRLPDKLLPQAPEKLTPEPEQ